MTCPYCFEKLKDSCEKYSQCNHCFVIFPTFLKNNIYFYSVTRNAGPEKIYGVKGRM